MSAQARDQRLKLVLKPLIVSTGRDLSVTDTNELLNEAYFSFTVDTQSAQSCDNGLSHHEIPNSTRDVNKKVVREMCPCLCRVQPQMCDRWPG